MEQSNELHPNSELAATVVARVIVVLVRAHVSREMALEILGIVNAIVQTEQGLMEDLNKFASG